MNAQDAEPYIYADNAATTPLSPAALDAMMPFLTDAFGNPSGIHRVARQAAEALGSARARMAELLGAERADEVYFTSGGSESDNWALRGAVQRFRDLYGSDAAPRIITSSIEHHAILHCCEALEREGVEVTYLPVDEHGFVRAGDLEAALVANEQKARAERASDHADAGRGSNCADADDKATICEPRTAEANGAEREAASTDSHRATRELAGFAIAGERLTGADDTAPRPPATALVSIMLANNEVGTIEPIRELAAVAHRHGAPFHTDAVQAVGHIAVDVRELGVDALSLSAHKFHGPRGAGALYLRDGFSIPPLIAGGAQERGERAGTENLAGIVGMTAALEEAVHNLGRNAQRVSSTRDELVQHILASCEGVHLTGAPCPSATEAADNHAPDRLPSIASFTCGDVDGELLVVLLDRAGVAAATGSACSTGSTEPSHVLTAMGISPGNARGALRLSLAESITREELDLLKQRIPAAIKRARLMSGIEEARQHKH